MELPQNPVETSATRAVRALVSKSMDIVFFAKRDNPYMLRAHIQGRGPDGRLFRAWADVLPSMLDAPDYCARMIVGVWTNGLSGHLVKPASAPVND